jgi:hypothetical protein
MRRRNVIGALSGAVLTWSFQARAERAARGARILAIVTDPANPITAQIYEAFLTGLRDLGYSEGKNLDVFEVDALSQNPAEFRSDVDLIVADGPEVALKAALALGRTVPIVILASACSDGCCRSRLR